MQRRTERLLLVLVLLGAAAGCARPPLQTHEVGVHSVTWAAPRGWEHLDHGRQQLFRRNEMQLSLADFGPTQRSGESLGSDSSVVIMNRVLESGSDGSRREIARHEHRSIGGVDWLVVETWDRVTHLSLRKVAVADNGGDLLVLQTERDTREPSGMVFDALLGSLVVLPRASAAPSPVP